MTDGTAAFNQFFATTWSAGAPSTPSQEIVVFEEEDEEVDQEGKGDHVEEENIGKHIHGDLDRLVEAQTEYDVAVFKRLLKFK